MLLRLGRLSEILEKNAALGPAVGSALGRGLVGGMAAIGRGAHATGKFLAKDSWKWGKRAAGGALVAGATLPMMAEAGKRSAQGMSNEGFQARMMGADPGSPHIPRV